MRTATIDSRHRAMVIATILALTTTMAGLALAATVEPDQVRLVGCLDRSGPADMGERSFTLIERESGDWIPVEGADELGDHLGQTVELTGTWQYDLSNIRYFVADSLKVVAESCEE